MKLRQDSIILNKNMQLQNAIITYEDGRMMLRVNGSEILDFSVSDDFIIEMHF